MSLILHIYTVALCIVTKTNAFTTSYTSQLHSIQDTSKNVKSVIQPVLEPDELHELALANTQKIPGSKTYLKSWRYWSDHATKSIRYALSQNLPAPVNMEATNKLQFELGQAADYGKMPSFHDSGGRSGYALDFFCRVLLLTDLLAETLAQADKKKFDSFENYQTAFESELYRQFHKTTNASNINVASIGGGPGYDFVAISLLAYYRNIMQSSHKTAIHSYVFDYEEGWSDLVSCMSTATQKTLMTQTQSNDIFSCDFGGKCDITKSLYHSSNESILKTMNEINIWICQYCVAENAVKLRENDFIFFRDIFAQANDSSLFIFTETTHRLWPEFVNIIQLLSTDHSKIKNNKSHGFEISFPKQKGRGGSYGWQMVICKKKGLSINDDVLDLCELFIKDRQHHQRKIENGFVRQKKKVIGAK